MRRFLALMLCAVFAFVFHAGAYAVNYENPQDNKPTSYMIENGEFVEILNNIGESAGFAEIKSSVTNYISLDDSSVSMNGAKIIEVSESNITPKFSLSRCGSNVPYGSASDYTEYISSRTVNVTLNNTLANISYAVLGSLLNPFVGLISTARAIASAILSAAMAAGTTVLSSDNVYIREMCYGHYALPQFYRQIRQDYYASPSLSSASYLYSEVVYEAYA